MSVWLADGKFRMFARMASVRIATDIITDNQTNNMTTRYEKQKARRIYETLRSNPKMQPRKIAAHYTKLMSGAAHLHNLLDEQERHGPTPALEQAIATAVKSFQDAHLADLGIELEWEHFQTLD